jgi:hypothetical protein
VDECNDEREPDPDMPDDEGGRLFRTFLEGKWWTMPATIAGIREFLPPERRDAFDEAIETTPARDMSATMVRWARPPEMEAAVERAHDRVRGLTEEADARLVVGEDPDVVRGDLRSRIGEGP